MDALGAMGASRDERGVNVYSRRILRGECTDAGGELRDTE